jgi:putative ABC transport system substrate-binding protein
MAHLGRREFIGLLGGAAAWPLAARAQQPAVPVVGFVRNTASSGAAHLVRAFSQGLSELGFVDGQNLSIEYRWTDYQTDQLPAAVTDLVRRRVSVIVATDTKATLVAKDATDSIPIVFTFGNDPVRLGIVANLNRPERNVTGVSFINTDLVGKRIGLLHELVPAATVIAVLADVVNTEFETVQIRDAQEGTRVLGKNVVVAKVRGEPDFRPAFTHFVQQGAGALLVGGGPFFNGHRRQIAALAIRHALPAIYPTREYVEVGGLMSYGTSITDAYRLAGSYVGRILKGATPAELPVLLPTKFTLVINLAIAKTLSLDIPPTLLARADEVIE